jgi:RNA polymerase sigma-70 factor, ECF subfamily
MPGLAAQAVAIESLANDADTFTQLVDEHQAMVFSLAYHCLGDRALAEEVAQDVFLELHRKLASLESPEHVRHWLRRVATHRSIDQSRRRKLRPQMGLDEVREPASLEAQSDPILGATLRRLVATLPEKPRLVVILRYQEDLDPADIAEVLEMPVRTVKSHLRRSLETMRRKMTSVSGGRCL